MNRRDMYYQAMLRELGAAYYEAVRGRGSTAEVASALQAVAKAGEAATGQQQVPSGHPEQAATDGTALRDKRWRVRDVMTSQAVSVTEHTTYKQVARLLSEYGLSALPVLSRGGRVIGVVSEADLLLKQERQHAARPHGMSWRLHRRAAAKAEACNAGQLMTSPAVTIHPDAPVGSAARLLNSHHLRRLPVVDPGGHLLGIVSRRDLLTVFLRPDQEIAAQVRAALTDVLLADPSAVQVRVGQGVVRLSGSLAEKDQISLATDLVAAIDGVVAVRNELTAATTADR
jgi:CBS domain-containing protein